MKPVAGARALLIIKIAALALAVLSTLFWVGWGDAFDVSRILHYRRGEEVVWLLFAIAEWVAIFQFAKGRRGTRAEELARATLILAAISLAVSAVSLVQRFNGHHLIQESRPVGTLLAIESIGLAVCFWLMLSRSLEAATPLTPVYFALFTVMSAFSLVLPWLPHDTQIHLLLSKPLYSSRIAASFVEQLLVIFLLLRVLRGGSTDTAPAPSAPGSRDIWIGTVWLGGGLVVTIGSIVAAPSTGGYVVTSGAIVYGLIRLIRGLSRTS